MHFQVTEGPYAHVEWLLGAVTGEEAMSHLYSFHLTVTSRSSTIVDATYSNLENGLIGSAVSLRMHDGDITRYGIIASLEVDPRREKGGGVVLRMMMRPKIWLLSLRKNTRIFQSKYLHEIVSQVLTESDICHRWNLQNHYPKRVYCTQYEETDYQFVSRILAEEGVFSYFEHVDSFTPDPDAADPSKGALATAAAIAGVVGAIGGAVAGATESNAKASGIIGMVGSAASIFSDAATPPVDPEADDTIAGSSGKKGPASGPTELFVFADKITGYHGAASSDGPPMVLRYGQPTTGGASDAVTVLFGERSAGTRQVELRDYNFRRPMALLSKVDNVPEAAALKAPLEYYEHHGEYEKPDIDDEQVQTRLEQLRAPTSVLKGESTSSRMLPGFVLDLHQAPIPFQDGAYVPVKIIHEAYDLSFGTSGHARVSGEPDILKVVEAMGTLLRDLEGAGRRMGEGELRELSRKALDASSSIPKSYQNRFEWVQESVVFRPPLPARIRHAVNESAVVVGPAGQQIYVDNYGRVKVQFHWDREGKYNENSSCWIRCLSTWAGAGFGFQFFPRVGMEVVVTFLGGDPDRPVIAGSLYNATHPTPEPLPQRLTRSGVRSQSVPGGGGFNELSFEDAQGVERIFIHAQKDLHEVVNDAHTTTVRGNESLTVAGDQGVGVSGNRMVASGGNSADIVGQNLSARIGGNRVHQVAKNSAELVRGNSIREVRGVAISETLSDELHVVRGDQNLTVHGHQALHVVSKKDGPKGSSVVYVDGSSYHTATGKVVIRAESADKGTDGSTLRLECGETYIEISGDTITLSAKNVAIKTSESFTVDGKAVDITGSDHVKIGRDTASGSLDKDGFKLEGVKKIDLSTKAGKLSIDDQGTAEMSSSGEARIKSSAVKLMSGSGKGDKDKSPDAKSPDTPPTQHLKVAFCHPLGSSDTEGIASVRFRLTTDDFVKEGTTGGDGSIDVEVPQGTRYANVILFTNEVDGYKTRYPSPLAWRIQIEDDLHAATDVQGARIRLRNLGYQPGADLTIASLDADPVTGQAIEEFQRDQRIRISGKLDEDDTGTKLNTLYGDAQ